MRSESKCTRFHIFVTGATARLVPPKWARPYDQWGRMDARSLARSLARRLGPTASPNGEHQQGVAPHAFECPASLGPVGVLVVAFGVGLPLVAP